VLNPFKEDALDRLLGKATPSIEPVTAAPSD